MAGVTAARAIFQPVRKALLVVIVERAPIFAGHVRHGAISEFQHTLTVYFAAVTMCAHPCARVVALRGLKCSYVLYW